MRSGRRDQRGATVVEAAFVVPIVLLFVFGLLDVGLWAFQSTQAAAAARDGARTAILDYTTADVAGSADSRIVEAAALRRIDVAGATVVATCLRADSAPVPCAQAGPGIDRVRVHVSWEREFPTFVGRLFGGRAQISAQSAMVIVGRPG